MSDPLQQDSLKQSALYEVALTHRSFAAERGGEDNERLEFLGDSVVQLCITELLYERFPKEGEGRLSQIRQQLVNTERLGSLARQVGLDQSVRLGRGEEKNQGRNRARLLAGVYEAVLGALYLEEGLEASQIHVRLWFEREIDDAKATRNPKNTLQEWAQAQGRPTPVYSVESTDGPPHQQRFVVSVSIESDVLGRGEGTSKQRASRAAAEDALRGLEK